MGERNQGTMKIGKEQVEHVAKLARLDLTNAEREAFSEQLSNILTYFQQLKAVQIDGVEPTATVLDRTNVFREDEARPSLPVEKALANAPDQNRGFFRVPNILEER